jgi:hypothetical protein
VAEAIAGLHGAVSIRLLSADTFGTAQAIADLPARPATSNA